MPLHDLNRYGISRERGFLSDYEIDTVTLPDDFREVERAADDLPALLTSGRVRSWLEQLPTPDAGALVDLVALGEQAVLRTAMIRYSFLVHAYVWGEATVPAALPANLAVPLVTLADAIGIPPVLNYAGYVLDNWRRLDKAGPIALDNIAMHQNFAGGQDENWFVLVHVAIEAAAGEVLDLAVKLVRAAEEADVTAAELHLTRMNAVWDAINAIFDRMPDRCDPYIYYSRVRPYIHGWKNNPATPQGLVYEGVGKFRGKPQAFRGQTGSQSSIVPAMDALFGVEHGQDELRIFLAELHHYRPPAHRRFIEDIGETSRLRSFSREQGPSLREAFNACVLQVARFRTRHLEYAASYINRQASTSPANDTDVGTGGTPFMKYLKKHRDESRAQLI